MKCYTCELNNTYCTCPPNYPHLTRIADLDKPCDMGGDPQRMDESDARFVTKDSGERKTFDSGMVRDVTTDKTDYTLVLDGPMFERWAGLLKRGAVKYDKR